VFPLQYPIDLFWHTHQMHVSLYDADCARIGSGQLIDHMASGNRFNAPGLHICSSALLITASWLGQPSSRAHWPAACCALA
jgi:hypothetical protein